MQQPDNTTQQRATFRATCWTIPAKSTKWSLSPVSGGSGGVVAEQASGEFAGALFRCAVQICRKATEKAGDPRAAAEWPRNQRADPQGRRQNSPSDRADRQQEGRQAKGGSTAGKGDDDRQEKNEDDCDNDQDGRQGAAAGGILHDGYLLLAGVERGSDECHVFFCLPDAVAQDIVLLTGEFRILAAKSRCRL